MIDRESTFSNRLMLRQIIQGMGTRKRNRRSLHYASLRSEVVTFLVHSFG
jgi:hypothetical protein